ncbi:MAG: hypothetical protein AAF806_15475 [Bacteroidota bacterium]
MGKRSHSNTQIKADVLRLLESMSEEDLSELNKKLKGTQSGNSSKNRGNNVQKLLEYFLKFQPDFEDSRMTFRDAYKAIFGEYNEKPNKAVNDYCNKLKKKVFTFIKQKQLEKNKHIQNILLAQYFAEKGLDRELDKIKPPEKIDEDYFLFSYLLDREKFILQTSSPPRKYTLQDITEQRAITINNLKKYYLLTYIAYWVNDTSFAINRMQKESVVEPDAKLIEEVKWVCTTEERQVIELWMESREFTLGNSDRSQFEVKVKELQHLLPSFDLANLIYLLLNDFSRKEQNYFKRSVLTFEYFLLLQKKGILNSVSLTPALWGRIISVSLELNRFDWIKQKTLDYAEKNSDGSYELFMMAKALQGDAELEEARRLLKIVKKKRGNSRVLIEQLLKSITHRLELSLNCFEDASIFVTSRINFERHLDRLGDEKSALVIPYKVFIKLTNALHILDSSSNAYFEADEEAENFFGVEKIVYGEYWLQTQFEQFIKPSFNLRKDREQLKIQLANPSHSKINRLNFSRKIEQVKTGFDPFYALANQHFLVFYEEIISFDKAKDDAEDLEDRICKEQSLVDRLWLLNQVFKLKKVQA